MEEGGKGEAKGVSEGGKELRVKKLSEQSERGKRMEKTVIGKGEW